MRTKLYLGGSKDAMTKRVIALEQIESDEEVYAGFKKEIQYMRALTKRRRKGALSYDTVSNLRRRLKTLEDSFEIIVATGPCHWATILMIVEKKFPQLQGKIVWIDSGEYEGLAAKIRQAMYKLLGPTVMECLAIVTRPWKYWTQYILPIVWDNICLYIFKMDPIDSVE